MPESSSGILSDEELAVLDRQLHDPNARSRYDVLSGGLHWTDDFPAEGTHEWEVISKRCIYRYLIACRASLTLGEESGGYRSLWEQVAQKAPNWPGLLTSRRNERARRRLLAAKRKEARCLEQLERELDNNG